MIVVAILGILAAAAVPNLLTTATKAVSLRAAVLVHSGAGERETLLLAQELHADPVLIDERDAHDEATRSNRTHSRWHGPAPRRPGV